MDLLLERELSTHVLHGRNTGWLLSSLGALRAVSNEFG